MIKFDNIKLERDNAAMQRHLPLIGLAAVLFALVGCDSVYQEDSYRLERQWPTAVVVSGVPDSLEADAAPLQASAIDQNGKPLSVSWSSSDPAVASVNSSGLVTVLTTGTAQIVAAAQGGKSGAVNLLVNPPVVKISGLPSAVSILGSARAVAKGSSGKTLSVTWSVDDTRLASISTSGQLTPKRAGLVTVTATLTVHGIAYLATFDVDILPGVTTFAGSGNQGSRDGVGTSASFYFPYGITVDSEGNLYVADTYNNKIRKITPAGVVTTVAGSGNQGSDDGIGTSASFYYPSGITVDSAGNLYVADTGNNKIRKITPAGVVTTLAGTGGWGSTDGNGTSASFNDPQGITVDSEGTLYVADDENNKIRKVTRAGVVTTLAGSGDYGSADGIGTSATFYYPRGITVDDEGTLYVADSGNAKIRKITSAGVVTTLAGSGDWGSDDGIGASASFYFPHGITVDSEGSLYVADTNSHTIRKITRAGGVTTLAGSGYQGSRDGIGTSASFYYPKSIATDSNGNLYVADTNNNTIRKVQTKRNP